MSAPLHPELRAELRRAFRLGGGARARRIGLELELIALDERTGQVAALAGEAGLVAHVRRHGRERGWIEEPSGKGAPKFRLPGGGALTFEPGGQLEFCSAPGPGAGTVLRWARDVVAPLVQALSSVGIRLLAAGVDPLTPLERTTLQIGGERYERMDAYFRSIGPWGSRMMRQTASLQINVDFGRDPLGDWRLLNAAAPYLAAAFANSRRYEGADTGDAAFRARIWRGVDPQRTGIFEGGARAVEEYEAFALAAPTILLGAEASARPFAELLATGIVSAAELSDHLTTLFPEVRPRGHLELRALDTVPLEWLAAPVAVVCGLVYDNAARAAALDVLGRPDPALLPLAAGGLREGRLAAGAIALVRLGLDGCRRLPLLVPPAELEIARAFAERYTYRRRTLADEAQGSAAAWPSTLSPAVA